MTQQERYERYLINNNLDMIIEVITIRHSVFSESYNITRNPERTFVEIVPGISVECRSVNMNIKRASSKGDLDEKYTIDITDIEGEIQRKAEDIPANSLEPIRIEYRLYMESDTTAPAVGPVVLQATTLTYNAGNVSISAQTPSLSSSRTGDIYTYERFPMLRAFL